VDELNGEGIAIPRWFSTRISLGDVLHVVATIVLMVLAWANLSNRMDNVERQVAANTILIQKLTEGQTLQNETLRLMNDMLKNYPPHAHVEGHILYPDGTMDKEK